MARLVVTTTANFSGGTWTDISTDVVAPAGMTIDWGMDGGRPDDNCARPGTCAFTLNNLARVGGLQGRYSPGHANCISGWGLNLKLRVTFTIGGSSRVLGPYYVADITPLPGQYGPQTVAVLATDWLEEAAETAAVTANSVGVDGSVVITELLANMDIQPTGTDLDTGLSAFGYPLTDLDGREDRVLAAFKGIAQSEGGYVYLTGAGVLTFESRARRLGNTVDDFTLDNSMHGLEAGRSRDALLNALRLTVHPFTESDGLVKLATLEGTAPIAQYGSTDGVTVRMEYTDPATGLACAARDVVGAVGPAYAYLTANSREDGLGVDMTLSCDVYTTITPTAAEIRVVNARGAYNAYVVGLEVWGIALVQSNPVVAVSEDGTSITAYGRRTLDVDMPYQSNLNVAQALADYWRLIYADADTRASSLSCVIVGDAALQALLLGVDVGSRIALLEPMTALDRSYWVQGVAVAIAEGPVVSLTLRLAPATREEYWLLGTSTLATDTIPAPV